MYLKKFRLDGRTAFVTGGGRGIGLAAAHAFAEAGARVVISDRDRAILDSGLAFLEQTGHPSQGELLDVTRSDEVERVAAELNRRAPVDILFANAGITGPDQPGEAMADATWRGMMDVNLDGVFWSCRAFGRFHAGARPRQHRHHRLDVRPDLQPAAAPGALQRGQGGGAPHDPVPGRGIGRARRAGQRHRAGLHRRRHVGCGTPEPGAGRHLDGQHPDATVPGRRRRSRRWRCSSPPTRPA